VYVEGHKNNKENINKTVYTTTIIIIIIIIKFLSFANNE
jgi:hypothetical protein